MKRIILLLVAVSLACSMAFADYLYDQPDSLLGVRSGMTWAYQNDTRTPLFDAEVKLIKFLSADLTKGFAVGLGMEKPLSGTNQNDLLFLTDLGFVQRKFINQQLWLAGELGMFVRLRSHQGTLSAAYGPMGDVSLTLALNQDANLSGGGTLRLPLGGEDADGIAISPYLMVTLRF